MKSPFVTSGFSRASRNRARGVAPAPVASARAPDTYRTARVGLAIFLSALAVAIGTFFGVMTVLMAVS